MRIVAALLLLLALPLVSSQSTTTWSFCYYITGVAAGGYTTSASGSITTLSTAITVNGRTAYNVTGLSGTRLYSDKTGRNSSNAIVGIASSANFTGVDQLLYSSWPSVDSNGLLYSFSGTAETPYGPVSGQPVVQLWVDAVNPAYSELIARTRFNEQLRESNGSITAFDSTGGDIVVLQDGGAAATAGTISSQCSYSYGTSASYSFCYYIESEPSAQLASQWSILSSGTLQATGPVTRRGRSAVIAHTASGTRTLTTGITSSSNGSAQSSAVVGIRGIDLDETAFVYNDNALYLTAPYLDDEGIVFILNQNATYSGATINTTDVQLYRGDIAHLYDEITPFVGPSYSYGFASSNLSYFQYSTVVSASTLAAYKCQGNFTSGTSSAAWSARAVSVLTIAPLILALLLSL